MLRKNISIVDSFESDLPRCVCAINIAVSAAAVVITAKWFTVYVEQWTASGAVQVQVLSPFALYLHSDFSNGRGTYYCTVLHSSADVRFKLRTSRWASWYIRSTGFLRKEDRYCGDHCLRQLTLARLVRSTSWFAIVQLQMVHRALEVTIATVERCNRAFRLLPRARLVLMLCRGVSIIREMIPVLIEIPSVSRYIDRKGERRKYFATSILGTDDPQSLFLRGYGYCNANLKNVVASVQDRPHKC